MNKSSKKGIIISIFIIVLIIVLGSVGVYVYINTDLFKSNETLFNKYIGQALESIQYTENEQMSKIEKLKKQSLYITNGEINALYEDDENQNNANIISNMNVTVNSKVNNIEKVAYAKANLQYNNENLFELEYANTDNIYALKSNEVVTAFLGIKNENLNVLMQKLGITTDINIIPNIIQEVDINELVKLSDEEKQHIKEIYMPIIINNISKSNYSKQENAVIIKDGESYNTTAYRLDLSEEEISNIIVKVLETLKEDSITLNLITIKAKLLGLDEQYTQVNLLTKQIDDMIQNIKNYTQLFSDGISITVYANDGKNVQTEILIKNRVKYTMYMENKNSKEEIYLLIENLDSEMNKLEIKLSQINTTNSSTIELLINENNETGISITLNNIETEENKIVNTTCDVVLSDNQSNFTLSYQGETNFTDEIEDIVKLDNSNCAVLNDYTADQLQPLIKAIYDRLETIVNEKANKIGWNRTGDNNTIINDNENVNQ